VDEAGVALTPLTDEVPAAFDFATAGAECAEPDGATSVVEIGPDAVAAVSDVVTFEVVAAVVELVLLALAAEFVALPLQARAAKAIEMRIERYIFPSDSRN
jgi:hypothetical protein